MVLHLIYPAYDYYDKMRNNVFESFENFIEPCTCKPSLYKLILEITVYCIYIVCAYKTKTYMRLTICFTYIISF